MAKHEYTGLNVVSGFITAGGYIVGLCGVGTGIFAILQGAVVEGCGLIFGGLVLGLMYIAFGEALEALRQIAINSAGGHTTTISSSSPGGLTQQDVYRAMLAALTDAREAEGTERPLERRPDPLSDDDASAMLREDASAAAARTVVCPACNRRIKISGRSSFKPGSLAKCPGCQQAIRV